MTLPLIKRILHTLRRMIYLNWRKLTKYADVKRYIQSPKKIAQIIAQVPKRKLYDINYFLTL